jgi:hypothetical protein
MQPTLIPLDRGEVYVLLMPHMHSLLQEYLRLAFKDSPVLETCCSVSDVGSLPLSSRTTEQDSCAQVGGDESNGLNTYSKWKRSIQYKVSKIWSHKDSSDCCKITPGEYLAVISLLDWSAPIT